MKLAHIAAFALLVSCGLSRADNQIVSSTISEREYLEAEISHERQERIAAMLEQHAQTAIAKEEVDRRLEEMNHLRAQIDTERGTFWGIKEQAEYTKTVDEKLDAITAHVNMGLGGVIVLQAVLVVAVGVWAANRKQAR